MVAGFIYSNSWTGVTTVITDDISTDKMHGVLVSDNYESNTVPLPELMDPEEFIDIEKRMYPTMSEVINSHRNKKPIYQWIVPIGQKARSRLRR